MLQWQLLIDYHHIVILIDFLCSVYNTAVQFLANLAQLSCHNQFTLLKCIFLVHSLLSSMSSCVFVLSSLPNSPVTAVNTIFMPQKNPDLCRLY